MLLENEFYLMHWNLIILYGSRQGETESVKNVSACDWSNLVGRLTGKISRASSFLHMSATRVVVCERSRVLKVIGPLWPNVIFNLPLLGGPIEVWLVAWAWLYISLGEPNAIL